jgi:hypothetical protein
MPETIWRDLATTWPLVTISVTLSLFGYLFRKPGLLIFGALLLIPFAWSLRAHPDYDILGPALPIFLLGAAVFVMRARYWAALVLVAVPVAVVVRYVHMLLLENGVVSP